MSQLVITGIIPPSRSEQPTTNALFHQAVQLHDAGKCSEALEKFDELLQHDPDHWGANINRGSVLSDLQRYDEACASYQTAASLKPDDCTAYCNLGAVLFKMGKLEESAAQSKKAIAVNPAHAESHCNLGTALFELNRTLEAGKAFAKATELKSDYGYAWYIQGQIAARAGRAQDALFAYDRAIEHMQDSQKVLFSKGLLLIALGEFEQGWELYEYRRDSEPENFLRSYTQPMWQSDMPVEALKGKTLFIVREQGLGDQIHVVRYAQLLADAGVRVIMETRAPLRSLLENLPGITQTVLFGEELPPFDYYCWLMSLPHLMNSTVDNLPAQIPYLFASADKIATWQSRLGDQRQPRIGLAWSGSVDNPGDEMRTIELGQLAPILELPCEFHCLQKEIRPHDETMLVNFPQIKLWQSDLDDFSDTAALVECMDLVIAVDTSVAHLAGALGKPVWLLLSNVLNMHFRWPYQQAHSPWYPSVRIWWQAKCAEAALKMNCASPGPTQDARWQQVIMAVAAELRRLYGKPSILQRCRSWLASLPGRSEVNPKNETLV